MIYLKTFKIIYSNRSDCHMFFVCFYGGFMPTVMSIVLIYGGFAPTVMSICFYGGLVPTVCLAPTVLLRFPGHHWRFPSRNVFQALEHQEASSLAILRTLLFAQSAVCRAGKACNVKIGWLGCFERTMKQILLHSFSTAFPFVGMWHSRCTHCIMHLLVASTSLPPTKSMCSDVRPEASELSTPTKTQRSLRTLEGAILGARLCLCSFTKAHKASACFSSFCFVRIFRMFLLISTGKKGHGSIRCRYIRF